MAYSVKSPALETNPVVVFSESEYFTSKMHDNA